MNPLRKLDNDYDPDPIEDSGEEFENSMNTISRDLLYSLLIGMGIAIGIVTAMFYAFG